MKESEKIYKYLDLSRKLSILWNMKWILILIFVLTFETPSYIGKKSGGMGNERNNQENPRCSIIENI